MKKIKHVIVLGAALISVSSAVGGAVSAPVSDTNRVLAAATTPQGPAVADGRYVTVKTPNAVSWSSFSWHQQEAGAALYQHTFLAKVQYHHQNGSTYLSLYDAKGGWHGYINANSVSVAAGPQGSWLADSGFATLTQAGQPIYQGFDGQTTVNSDRYQGQTFKITGAYHWFDGTVYASLYDAAGHWFGYMAAGSFSRSANPQGTFQPHAEWVAMTHPGYQIWKSFAFTSYTKAAANEALEVKGRYQHANGSVYDSVYDVDGHWLGYVNAKAVTTITDPVGQMKTADRYVTVTDKDAKVYKDMQFTAGEGGSAVYQHTYHAVGEYTHANGKTYLVLHNAQDQFAGIVNASSVAKASGTQGAWLAANGYVTLNSQNALYGDFGLSQVKTSGSTVAGNTYKVTGQYHTFAGRTLYSVYAGKQWLGYIDSSKAKLVAGQTGSWISKTGYFTTTKAGQPIWRSFFGSSQSSSSHYQTTYQIKGQYHAYTGATYYSLYAANGSWLGYINANNGSFATGPEGAWMAHSGKVTLSHTGYPIWQGFFTNQVNTTTKLHNRQYSATGQYRHFNGSLYYSLYDGKKWLGYVNAAATTPTKKSGWYSVNGVLKYYDQAKAAYTKTFSLVYYSQLDRRWSGRSYGGINFGKTGCGQASIAMVVSGFGTRITPSQAADYSHRYGTFDTPGEVGSAESDLTKVADHYGVKWQVMSSRNQLQSYLEKGYPATVCLDLGGGVRHIVVLTGYANGSTTVHDPWSGLLFSGRHSLSQVWSLLSWKADNKNMGASAAVVYIGK